MAEMQANIVGSLEAVVADHPGDIVVVVSHADPIKAAMSRTTPDCTSTSSSASSSRPHR